MTDNVLDGPSEPLNNTCITHIVSLLCQTADNTFVIYLRDQLERQVLLGREATLGPLAHPESRVSQVLLARREQRFVSGLLL